MNSVWEWPSQSDSSRNRTAITNNANDLREKMLIYKVKAKWEALCQSDGRIHKLDADKVRRYWNGRVWEKKNS